LKGNGYTDKKENKIFLIYKEIECVMFSGKEKRGEMITINDNIK
jgi:hypothetical protein